jgi:acetyltransferase-like isoleucine patch superfamily enzyme
MLNWRYGRLLWRYLWRRFLTPAGWRWETDGPVFFGRGLQLQIAKGAKIRFGRFSWIGDGTKIRCHEGVVEIGPKTVMGQECTISAYKRVRIGEQCVIADRAMFIDFDHGVVEVERPIRVQGIYTRECVVGSNVWVGYGACILRGVQVGDNAIVGTNSVVPGRPGERCGRRRAGAGSGGCARRRRTSAATSGARLSQLGVAQPIPDVEVGGHRRG